MPMIRRRTAGALSAAALTLLLGASLADQASAAERFAPGGANLATAQPDQQSWQAQRQVIARYVQGLWARSAGRPQSGPGATLAEAGHGPQDASFCCWQDSNGQTKCKQVDLLTICIDSVKVTCDDTGCHYD